HGRQPRLPRDRGAEHVDEALVARQRRIDAAFRRNVGRLRHQAVSMFAIAIQVNRASTASRAATVSGPFRNRGPTQLALPLKTSNAKASNGKNKAPVTV